MRSKVGFAPYTIYGPYPTYVRDSTAALLLGKHDNTDRYIEYFCYGGMLIRYQSPGVTRLGSEQYKVVHNGL